MRIGTVVEMWRYPVKSMGGERLTGAVEVTAAGIEGDRAMAVVDDVSGKVLSAKTVPLLLQVQASWDGTGVRIADESGAVDLVSSDDDADARLSAWLGHPVSLRAPVPGHRSVFDMELDPDDPTELALLQTPAGSFFDSRSTLHLLSTASLGSHDVRRFRPNIVVEAEGDDPNPEDAWLGRELRVAGDVGVQVSVRKATARCVLITKAQPGLDQDSSVLRDLLRTRDGHLGVYLDPLSDGRISPGDAVDLA